MSIVYTWTVVCKMAALLTPNTSIIINMDVLGVSKAYYVHYVPHITWDKLKQTNQNADNRIKAISVLRQCALWSMRVTRALPPILHPLRYDRDTGREG